jgi:hypothetical protein
MGCHRDHAIARQPCVEPIWWRFVIISVSSNWVGAPIEWGYLLRRLWRYNVINARATHFRAVFMQQLRNSLVFVLGCHRSVTTGAERAVSRTPHTPHKYTDTHIHGNQMNVWAKMCQAMGHSLYLWSHLVGRLSENPCHSVPACCSFIWLICLPSNGGAKQIND